jgi:Uma2 family endonuclease
MIGSDQNEERPDLAIEVMWTSGGLSKLEICRRLAVPEVWVWRGGGIEVHVLAGENYEKRPASAALPGLAIDLVAELATMTPTSRAIRELRARLAGR